MEVTIDEAKNMLMIIENSTESLKTAIEIMRKYQKIQEIYQWAKDRSYLVETDDIMDKLKEVVEDGINTTNTGSN